MKININLLPPEFRPNRWALPLTIFFIVIILAVGYYGYGFLVKNVEAEAKAEPLQVQLASLRSELEKVSQDTTVAEYTQRVAEAQNKLGELEGTQKDFEIWNVEKIYMKSVVRTIRELVPHDVTLTAIEQQGDDEITVDGEITGETQSSIIVVEYAKLLEARYIFSQVALELSTEERATGENNANEEYIIFTILLKVVSGAT
ncbi:PilN domain-containing protein [Chloroflexota bacterium]